MRYHVWHAAVIFSLACVLMMVSCAQLLELDEFKDQPREFDQGGAGSGALCSPHAEEPCYGGPDGTQGVGLCKGGTRTCNTEGTAWSDCFGQVVPGVETCDDIDDEDCDGWACGQPIWSRAFKNAIPSAVGVDGVGNIYVAGEFYVTIAFSEEDSLVHAGNGDVFLVKFSPEGKYIWSKRFGDAVEQSVDDLDVDEQGNIALVGRYGGVVNFGGDDLHADQGNVYVARLDASGNHIWSQALGGRDGSFSFQNKVAITTSLELIVGGDFVGTFGFGSQDLVSFGSRDMYLVKYAAGGGDPVWLKQFGADEVDTIGDVATDGSGGVFVSGAFKGTIDVGGVPVSSYDGGYSVFLAKFGFSGSLAWVREMGGSSSSLAVDRFGGIVSAGPFNGVLRFGDDELTASGLDRFVVKYDGEGEYLWSRRLDDGDYVEPVEISVAVDDRLNVLVVGSFFGSIEVGGDSVVASGGNDVRNAFIAKLDETGARVWSRGYGGASSVRLDALSVHRTSGGVVAAGYFSEGSVVLGNDVLSSDGEGAMLLVRVAP